MNFWFLQLIWTLNYRHYTMVMLIRVGEFERCCFEGRNEEQEEFANGFTPLLGLSSSLSRFLSSPVLHCCLLFSSDWLVIGYGFVMWFKSYDFFHDCCLPLWTSFIHWWILLISLCSAAEYLFQIVHGALPQLCFDPNSSVPPAEITVLVLDYLYTKLDQVSCARWWGWDYFLSILFFVVSQGFCFTPYHFKCTISVNSR